MGSLEQRALAPDRGPVRAGLGGEGRKAVKGPSQDGPPQA